MAKLSTFTTRVVVGALVVVIVVAAAVYFVFGASSDKELTAQFRSAVGLYTGTPVRILGVNVGEITGVHPKGEYVEVTMTYDSKYDLPSNVTAQTVANSLVSDRYIQLTPAMHTTRAAKTVLPNKATLPPSRTGGPAELDDIYAALNTLAVALGPQGANKGGKQSGALSELLKVSAANLQGNGKALGQSISDLSKAAQTLADQRNGLFGTVKNLQKFVATLKASDGQVRLFNQQLARVTGQLASERSELGAALHDLGLALDDVSAFVKNNAGKFHTDIRGLEQITNILVKEKASLNETLAVAPYALINVVHAYIPNVGALATRGNLASLLGGSPQELVCSLLTGLQHNNLLGPLESVLGSLLGPAVENTCKGVSGSVASASRLTPNTSDVAEPMLIGATP